MSQFVAFLKTTDRFDVTYAVAAVSIVLLYCVILLS
jgi:hypothetical protein